MYVLSCLAYNVMSFCGPQSPTVVGFTVYRAHHVLLLIFMSASVFLIIWFIPTDCMQPVYLNEYKHNQESDCVSLTPQCVKYDAQLDLFHVSRV